MCTFHQVVQNSPDHLWPAEIERKVENEEKWTASEPEKRDDLLCPLCLECTESFTYFMP